MYDTAAVLSVRTNTCLLNSSGQNCRKARCTASSSRQLMCQSSRGPVQSPEAACPLHVAPQPVLEASVVTTTCRVTCSKGSLENATELGRSPGELNRVAESNCACEPTRRAGQRKPRLQTPCKWLQRHNRRTRSGAANRSKAGWYRRPCVLTHPRRTP